MDANFRLSQLILKSLIENGCRDFIFCPGARNSPLIRTLFELTPKYRLHCDSHFDERGAAFYALGLAKSCHRPAAIITTSGTAIANLYPAIVEAFHSDIPLIAITADRPLRLQGISANQTIFQEGFFRNFTRAGLMLKDTVNTSEDEKKILIDLKKVVKMLGYGPIHINCPFDEPLVVQGEMRDEDKSNSRYLNHDYWTGEASRTWIKSNGLKYSVQEKLSRILSDFISSLKTTVRGLVILGELNQSYKREDIFSFIEILMDKGWYVIAEVQSGMRDMIFNYFDSYGWGSGRDFLLENYSLLLKKEKFTHNLNIDTIIHLGGRLVDKELNNFLKKQSKVNYTHVDSSSHHYNPNGTITHHYHIDPPLFCRTVVSILNSRWNHSIRHEVDRVLHLHVKSYRFRRVDMELTKFISNYTFRGFNELEVARSLSRFSRDYLSGEGLLFVGNSMPIRDLNTIGSNLGFAQVFVNRGVSGIDGLIATGAGIAKGIQKRLEQPKKNMRLEREPNLNNYIDGATVRAMKNLNYYQRFYSVIGDLSALHDINSLGLCRQLEENLPITLIVINNQEGTIFRHLPMASIINNYPAQDQFYCHHHYDFSAFANAVNLQYKKVNDAKNLDRELRELHKSQDSCLLEIKINAQVNWEEHIRFHLDVMKHIDHLFSKFK